MNPDESSSPRSGIAIIILAAGLGTRMRSHTPKELQPLAGRRMIDYVLRAAFAVNPDQVIVVLSPAKADIAPTLPAACQVAWQDVPQGTGHAAAQALPLLQPHIKQVAVLFGDHPLLTDETVTRLFDAADSTGALVTLLTVHLQDPASYGRLRYHDGRIVGIVEAKEDDQHYDGPVEINSGISCYQRHWFERELPAVPRSSVGEYYLTSLVERAAASTVERPVVSVVADKDIAFGVNDRVELSDAERVIRRRINERIMRSGVAIVDPSSTFIDDEVAIGQDSRIEPFTVISGQTAIGERCIIGPYSIVRDSRIGDECVVLASCIERSEIGHSVEVGPYSHFRPGARIADHVHIGNYVEVKNSSVGSESQIGHFSYVGDAEIGSRVNIGAGTITANFDGVSKHRTIIGDDAFIGSDTILRAPVEVGRQARTGAGSVVIKDVADGSTVVGVPARPIGDTSSRPATDPSRSGI